MPITSSRIASHLTNLGASPIHVFSGECHKLAQTNIPVINCTIGNPGHPMEAIGRDAAASLMEYPLAYKAFWELYKDASTAITRESYRALKNFIRNPERLDHYLNPRPLSARAQREIATNSKMVRGEDGLYRLPKPHDWLSADTAKELQHYFDQEVAANISYSPIRGYPRVLQSAARYLNMVYGIDEKSPLAFNPTNMGTSASATAGFNQSARATVAPNDVFVITAPYYAAYNNTSILLDAHKVVVPTQEKNSFIPTNEDIDRSFEEAARKYGADKIKNWFINYPNNPTGAYLGEEDAKRLAKKIDELVVKYPNLTVTLDDAYVDVSSAKNHPIRNYLKPETLQSVIMIYTASKAMALAGDRLGIWETNNAELAGKMTAIASSTTMNSPTLAQAMLARIADYWVKNPERAKEASRFYASNTELFSQGLNDRVAKFKDWLPAHEKPFIRLSRATLYAFPNVEAFIGLPTLDGFEKDDRIKHTHIQDAYDFSISLLHMHEKGVPSVGAIPGQFYGADPRSIRFSLPFPSHKPLNQALDSIEKLMELGIEKVKTQLREQGIEPSQENVRAEIAKNKEKALAELAERTNQAAAGTSGEAKAKENPSLTLAIDAQISLSAADKQQGVARAA